MQFGRTTVAKRFHNILLLGDNVVDDGSVLTTSTDVVDVDCVDAEDGGCAGGALGRDCRKGRRGDARGKVVGERSARGKQIQRD